MPSTESLSISTNVRPIRSESGLLLLDAKQDRLFAFSDSARIVWESLAAGRPMASAAADLGDGLGIEAAQAQRDIRNIVSQWLEAGLLDGRGAVVAPDAANEAVRGPATPHSGWAMSWTCRIGGLRVSIAEEHPHGAKMLRNLFGPFEVPDGEIDTRFEIRHPFRHEACLLHDGREVVRTNDYGLLIGALYQCLLERLHPGVRWHALIHGGAAALDGKGVGFPAPSGSGKTTLVAGLIAAGFDYVADDLLAVSGPEGRIVPWPMPLSIKSGSWSALERLHPQLAEAPVYWTKGHEARLLMPPAHAWLAPPVPLEALVFPRYRPGAKAVIEPITAFEAFVRLLNDRIWLGHPLTEESVSAFVAWLEGIACYSLVHGDLDAAEQAVRSVLAG